MTRRDLAPAAAVERWLAAIRSDRSEQTRRSYYYRLKLFVEWCEDQDIDSMHDLDGWLIDEYITHREAVEPTANTRKNELTTLKKWLEYCENIGVVSEGLADTINVPTVPPAERASSIKLATEDAMALLSHYRDSPDEFGTRAHMLLELFWHVGCRVGGLQALDVDDFQTTDDGRRYLVFRNRPESDTRLKKGANGERPVILSEQTANAVEAYIDRYRDDVTDDYGREPLVTSILGRPTKGTMRDWAYQATLPCVHGPCPHDKNPDTCRWTKYNHSSKCPSSRAPHHIRTGAITWMRDQGLPAEIVAERVNASVSTIEEYYDQQDPVAEMLRRRAPYFQNLDIQQDDNLDQ